MESNDPSRAVRVIREPKVYLVGRQTIDRAQVDAFLQDHGVAWQTDTEVAGEHLIEIAGRVCYDVLRPPSTGREQGDTWTIFWKFRPRLSVLEHAVWCFLFTGVSCHPDSRVGAASSRLGLQPVKPAATWTSRLLNMWSPMRSPPTRNC